MEAKYKQLRPIFESFCAFGERGAKPLMDGGKFAKLCKDCGVLDRKNVTPTQVDLVFTKSKEKGARKITFDQFIDAVKKLSAIKYPDESQEDAFDHTADAILNSQGPAVRGTEAHTGGVYDKLTDTSLYTGAHKERFDDSGKGRGLAGRESVAKHDGAVQGTRKMSDSRGRRNSDPVVSGNVGATSSRRSQGRASEPKATPLDLRTVFFDFCNFGGVGTLQEMDNAKFSKLCRDTGIVDKEFSSTTVDLIFAKVKPRGKRTLNYNEFQIALQKIGEYKYPDDADSYDKLVHLVVSSGGPKTRGTGADTGGIYAKLTDSSQYTGAHKHRFDKTGHGKGLAGRDSVNKGGVGKHRGGDVNDLSQITRPNLS